METLRMLAFSAAWEWINIALEYTAGAWARLPRFFWAAVGINLVTHPLFMCVLDHVGHEPGFVLLCELVIWLLEWGLLCLIYRNRTRLLLLEVAVAMNAASYLTGLLIA